MIAHVGGVPVEEALLPFAGGAGAGLILLGRAWVLARLSDGFLASGGSLFLKRQFRRPRPESEKHDGLGIHSDT